MQTLKDRQLFAKFPNVSFGCNPLLSLVTLNLEKGIRVDLQKIEVVKQWPRPTSARDIRSFNGLAGYSRRFVEIFSSISSPLTRLTHNMVMFQWLDDCEKSFAQLKTRLRLILLS